MTMPSGNMFMTGMSQIHIDLYLINNSLRCNVREFFASDAPQRIVAPVLAWWRCCWWWYLPVLFSFNFGKCMCCFSPSPPSLSLFVSICTLFSEYLPLKLRFTFPNARPLPPPPFPLTVRLYSN